MGDEKDDATKNQKEGDTRDGDEAFDEEIFEEAEFEAEGWDEISGDPEQASKLLKALEGVVPDVVKRAVAAGMGGLAVSEEKIREALSDRKVARQIASYLLEHVDATKREVLRIVSKEIREFLEHMDFSEELAELLTTLSLEARIEVRFIPNDESIRPKASGKVAVKGEAEETKDDGDEQEE